MIVAEAVGRALAACGAGTVFGVVGSGNFHVTNALVAGGARFVAARHEGGAATMADAYARMSGHAGVVTVHQGPGLTNAMTGLTEAAKSRTPVIVVAGEATEAQSNFHIDQAALALAVGAVALRVTSAGAAVEQAVEAYRVAVGERRTVLLNLPLDVQAAVYEGPDDVEGLVAGLLPVVPPSGLPSAPATAPRQEPSVSAATFREASAQASAFGEAPSASAPDSREAPSVSAPAFREAPAQASGFGEESPASAPAFPAQASHSGEGSSAQASAFREESSAFREESVQASAFRGEPGRMAAPAGAEVAVPAGSEVAALAAALESAARPVFIAGRGARQARRELEDLAERTGALLATSAVAKGLFRGSPWDLDVSGGFATPLTAELVREADLVVAWGCALNMWTTRHGALIGARARVAKVDLDAAALKTHVPADLGVVGDVAEVARAVTAQVAQSAGYRTAELAARIGAEGRWQAMPYEDESGGGRIDPRTLTIGLDELLPAERIVSIDSGNFMGYPSMFLDVPDEGGFCFTQAFQSVGLGLATAIGAAVARPDRLPVAALGDGGTLMGLAELETVVRLGLPMVIVVYDDEAYGAEVHHFGPHGHPLGTVTFPPADLAAIARGHGLAAVTVTAPEDLAGVADWLNGPRDRPLLVHAKVTGERGSWWLEEAFKGH
ncbi:hypothetical protein GCM10009850_024110 [Nonomuraea monospora]|uniref:Thiamine pyrophosphate-dependent acetolactate synthase large subunit-like protein n=1 Tax=Nonomuraea monospora TaxID=568818 RepID=A0ABN3CC57_9ACTN